MLVLTPIPAGLLAQHPTERHIAAARAWGYRIGIAARDALEATDAIERTVGDRDLRVQAIATHFGLENEQHSLDAEPLAWFRLGETQATKGLQHFLSSGDGRALLFLKALVPDINWPSNLTGIKVESETRAGRGRVDLLLHACSEGIAWGAVIEAKFEHSMKSNPLSDYMQHGKGLRMRVGMGSSAERTGALIVLGKRVDRQTRKRLARNQNWRFVHWREVLRRFDAALVEDTVDEDFRRFRRTLWERSGDLG